MLTTQLIDYTSSYKQFVRVFFKSFFGSMLVSLRAMLFFCFTVTRLHTWKLPSIYGHVDPGQLGDEGLACGHLIAGNDKGGRTGD